MSKIIVYVEHAAGAPTRASLEALGAARSVSENVCAVIAGEGAEAVAATLGAAGATRAVALSGPGTSPDALAADIAKAVGDQGGTAFLACTTSSARDIAPRVAAHLDSVLFSDCTGLVNEGAALRVTRPWLAGKVIATLESSGAVLCATLRRNTFAPFAGGGSAEVVTVDGSSDFKAILKGIAEKVGSKLDVSEAPVIVAGGRGLKEAGNFALIEDLANAFGNAAVGASRAVVDAGWRPHSEQVGQTGKTVSPQLYIAIGISGAIQHLAGMKTSGTIVAINKDADAPIFKIADYGLVGDALEILPALTAAVKELKAQG